MGGVGLERQREAAGPSAAHALRRVLAARTSSSASARVRMFGRQHAPRAGVEHALDVLLAERVHAHERRARVAGDGGEHRGQRRQVDGAVLGVDEEPVEADRGHHLGHQRIAEVQETAERRAGRARMRCLTWLGVMVLRSIARRCGSLGAMLNGKTGIVFGVANKRSIAWAIAQALAGAGHAAGLHLSGRAAEGERGGAGRDACRARSSTRATSAPTPRSPRSSPSVERDLGRLDTLVHSVAYARKEDLEGEFLATEREGFRVAHDVSAYSLVALARGGGPADGEGRRRLGDRDDLLRRGEGRRRLQRHGRGQGLAGGLRALPGRRPRARAASASTRSRRGR